MTDDNSRGPGDDISNDHVIGDDFVATNPDSGILDAEVEELRAKYGLNEIPFQETPLYRIFLRQFMGFLPFLIELTAIISLGVQDYINFAIIVSILLINGVLGFREEYIAKKHLDELSHSLGSDVTVRRSGAMCTISTKDVVPGDIIILVGGTILPADCKWIRGDKMLIDTAALTGEPVPRKYPSVEFGDIFLAGTTVVAGECYAQVLLTGTRTEVGKAQEAILKDRSVRVISVFQQKTVAVVQILVLASLVMVIAILLVEGFVYDAFEDDVKKVVLDALGIMVASIPVGLPLVLQVNLALGASFLAKQHHAIITSIPALQDIASMSILCSDKTGTLTTANMSVIPERIFPMEGYTAEDVVRYAYLCSNPDKKEDPIDRAIVETFRASMDKDSASEYQQIEILGFNPTVKRVVAFVQHEDKTLTIAKGLPAKILNTEAGATDDHELQWKVEQYQNSNVMDRVASIDKKLSLSGYKTIGVSICEGNAREMQNPVWKFVGLLPMLDPPRTDTRATIESLNHANITVKMITGDHVNVGQETARIVGLGRDVRAGEEVRNADLEDKKAMIWQADGFAAVLPSDKREIVMILRNEFGLVTGMTGDGVNDAPALLAAQVGIAVHGATDAAKNAADLILTQPGLTPIYGAVLESRRIFTRIKAYVVYRVAASIILVLTLSVIIFSSGCTVDSLFVIILALLNDISMIPVAYDNASATTKPQLPNSKKMVQMSMFYGIFHSITGLIFIFGMANSESLDYPIKLERDCSDATQGFIWFHLLLVTELAIFSVRAPKLFFQSMPSPYLLIAVALTFVGSASIARLVIDLPARNMLWIILYNLVAFCVADILKLLVRYIIKDQPGDVIESDDIVDISSNQKSESERAFERKRRYEIHNESSLPRDEQSHFVEVRKRKQLSGLQGFFSDMGSTAVIDGFANRAYPRPIHAGIQSPSADTSGTVRRKQLSWPL